MGKYLTREAVFAAKDILTEDVACPEWGGSVLVWTLSGDERDAIEQKVQDGRHGQKVNLKGLQALIVQLSVRDETGKQIFTPADVEALSKKSSKPLTRIYKVAARLAGLTEDDEKDLLKN